MKKLLSLIIPCLIYFNNNCMELTVTKAETINNETVSMSKEDLYKILNIDLAKINLETIQKLNCLLNFIYMHNQTVEHLDDIINLLPKMLEYQNSRYVKGKFIKGILLPNKKNNQESEDLPLEERLNIKAAHVIDTSTQEIYRNEEKLPESASCMQVFTSEGIATWLQLSTTPRDNDLDKRIVQLYDLSKKYLTHKLLEVRLVAGVKHHMFLSHFFLETLYELPKILHIAFKNSPSISTDDVFKELINCLHKAYPQISISQLANLLSKFQSAPEIFTRVFGIMTFKLSLTAKDDISSMYVTEQFVEYAQSCKKIKNLDDSLKCIERIYSAIDNDLSNLRKKIKNLTLEEKVNLKNINPQIFNIKSSNILPNEIRYTNLVGDSKTKKEALAQSTEKPTVKLKPNNNRKKNKKKSSIKVQDDNLTINNVEDSKTEISEASPNKTIELPEITYAPRIATWFEIVLPAKNSKQYASHFYHTYSTTVDQFLLKYGISTPYENKTNIGQIDTCYSLIGIIKGKNNSIKNVLFSICLSAKDNVCYHRGFDEKNIEELISEYCQNNYWKIFFNEENFPELGKSNESQLDNNTNKNDTVISEDEFCIKIYDALHDAEITLIKPNA